MNLASPPSFRAEDYPDVPPRFLENVNRAFRELYEAVARIPGVEQLPARSFVADGSGVATVDFANPLPQRPTAVAVDELRPDSGVISAAWSFSWSMTSSGIRVVFRGLTASSKYFATVSVK